MSTPRPASVPPLDRRSLLLGSAALLGAAATIRPTPAEAATVRNVVFHRFAGAGWNTLGTHSGTRLVNGWLHLGAPAGRAWYTDPYRPSASASYETATWTSGIRTIGFGADALVPSWRAETPAGTWVQVELRARAGGAWSRWFVLGRWSTASIAPTTVDGQADAVAKVSTDTLVPVGGARFDLYQVRVVLRRRPGAGGVLRLGHLGVCASALPTGWVPTSAPGVGRGRALAVPAYSQMRHRGHYPQWGGGGAAWCSATSLAMVLAYWGKAPTAAERAWVPAGHADPQVDHIARSIYDGAYEGTGNWAFNTAYAGARGLDAFVTRVRSLAEAERFIVAGIPLVVSTRFTKAQLTGAGYGTAGHLMVLRGFTGNGDVLVNDPASHLLASNAAVPTTYRRGEYENAMARSGGAVYVLRPPTKALPAVPNLAQRNWG